ncbi:FAD/NAD(P)-binding domain-containing protein [Mollisia scopiformis]|uniref:FAD/NAD(P)-binding domain-containing protein n=1 Tax=Mollisia scopiformis TaxID=149040 RepID=A0A132B5V5_MOLSC|nr:FAD/NAD(P)-binding domain-containing protein [Mollisia scopiformis]KUJ07721.1 FAD/NAD(P)-binding domain-containing protein [Mollisia scopiformis]
MSSSQTDIIDSSIRLEKVKNVVVIGAGISGIVTTAHLLRIGLNVTVIERADKVGGAWNYSPQPDPDPPFPSMRPPTPELQQSCVEGLSLQDMKSRFAPPGPVYASMKSRNSAAVMQTSLLGWPEGTEDYMGHEKVLAYLQDLACVYHVNERARFSTRVESVAKRESDDRWLVQTCELIRTTIGYTLKRDTCEFDAVVVATGRYNVPRVPDIPGLSTWKQEFPSRVSHSRQYRTPDRFCNKIVLVIGGFISSLEITNDLTSNGAKVYHSAKDTMFDFRDRVDHENAEKVPMVGKFTITSEDVPTPRLLDDDSPIPGRVILESGRVLEHIHHVIIATGYLCSYPFLGPTLEAPSMPLQDADEKVIITADYRTVHNLHEDIFYIPDPTLAFIGVSHFASTFSLYDFQAQVLATVFAGRVRLPSQPAMEVEQMRRKSRVLPGTFLNSIFLLDDFVIRRLLEWVNQDLVAGGFEALRGPDPKWRDEFKVLRENARPLLGKFQDNYLSS